MVLQPLLELEEPLSNESLPKSTEVILTVRVSPRLRVMTGMHSSYVTLSWLSRDEPNAGGGVEES
jgi:hypothetical protein